MGVMRLHRWSGFNNPIMWAAAGRSEAPTVLTWISDVLHTLPTTLHGVNGALTSEIVRHLFPDIRRALRQLGIRDEHGLLRWLEQDGFQIQDVQINGYMNISLQEHILQRVAQTI
eukprot:388694-Pyramimonas_sp.AAC.1